MTTTLIHKPPALQKRQSTALEIAFQAVADYSDGKRSELVLWEIFAHDGVDTDQCPN